MGNAISFLQGKKTHILVLVYVLLVMFSGGGDEAGVLDGFNDENLKKALPALMLSTLKAAWDRKE